MILGTEEPARKMLIAILAARVELGDLFQGYFVIVARVPSRCMLVKSMANRAQTESREI